MLGIKHYFDKDNFPRGLNSYTFILNNCKSATIALHQPYSIGGPRATAARETPKTHPWIKYFTKNIVSRRPEFYSRRGKEF